MGIYSAARNATISWVSTRMPLETAAGCDTPPPPTLIGNGAHPFTIPRVRDSNHLTSYLFAFPRDHRDSFISPKERDARSVPRRGTRFLAC